MERQASDSAATREGAWCHAKTLFKGAGKIASVAVADRFGSGIQRMATLLQKSPRPHEALGSRDGC